MEKTLRLPSILIYCEGPSDKKFVKSIKRAYGDNPRFRINAGNGGSQEQILNGCIKVDGEYEKYCVIDATPQITKETREKATKNSVILVEINPFLECVILNVLENNNNHDRGFDKNTSKDKLKKISKAKGSLDDLFNSYITKAFLNDRKKYLNNFIILLGLFEKYKQEQINPTASTPSS